MYSYVRMLFYLIMKFCILLNFTILFFLQVSYSVNGDGGYVADVTYEGEAKPYVAPAKPAYAPAPAPAYAPAEKPAAY